MIEEAPTPDEPVPEAASEAEASDAVVDDTVSDDSKEAVPEEVELPEEVLENEDLLQLVLQHARMSPAAFVIASRVSKAWHHVCQRDDALVLSAVRKGRLTRQATVAVRGA